jgi:lipopolysaccharide transport system permease protein
MRPALLALWRFRYFIGASIRGEFKLRYARSRLGACWSILHPLAQSAIYVAVLAEVLGARLPHVAGKSAYAIYLLAGMAAWSLFSEVLTRSIGVFVDNAGTLKKVAFPRLCLPAIIGGSALLSHALLLLALAIIMAALGHWAGPAWLVLPVGAAILCALGFGVGILAGIFHTFCRDVGQVLGVVMQLWFWATPVVYPIEAVPAGLRWLIDANPLTPLVAIYQNALLWHSGIAPASLLPPVMLAAVSCLIAVTVYRRASAELMDAL